MDAGMCTINSPAAAEAKKTRFHEDDPLIVTRTKDCNETRKNEHKIIKRQKEHILVKSLDEEEKELIPRNKIAAARRYQIEVLEKALQGNTIIFLETGCGKTLIAVLLIRQLGYKLRTKGEKRIAVFLAPTVHLVIQQSEVLKINTDLKVNLYYGAKGVDYWSYEMWQTEVDRNEVLVMTPQVFLDALRHSFVKMGIVELLILDECHHTQKQHAYAKIMNEYYHTEAFVKPKVFGLTASPVIRKGVSSSLDCAKQMQELELILDSKVYSLKDRVELEYYAPTPNQKTVYYERSEHTFEPIMENLTSLRDKYQQSRIGQSRSMDQRDFFKDDVCFAKKLRKKIQSLHRSLEYCLQELGLWCAFKGAEILRKKDMRDVGEETNIDLMDALWSSKEAFLTEALQVLQSALPEGAEETFNTEEDIAAAVNKGLLTPKVQRLVRCLFEYRDVLDMRCIVFVERVVGAIVLAEVANAIGCLSFLNFNCLSGNTAALDIKGRKKQQHVIENFRAGKVNVLIATDVAEEGLDVQGCSSVIRFDLSKSVRSFIQSRGRARRHGSDYVIFLERNNQKQEDLLLDVIRSEESMRSQAVYRTTQPISATLERLEVEYYRVESTGATVNTDSSISFIYRFCSKLPGDKYYLPRPEFSFVKCGDDDLHVCILTLPPNGPFSELIGPPRRNLLLAKQMVCLEACKKLHVLGQITDHLLPVVEVVKAEEEEIMNMGAKKVAGAGTTKRKELHSTAETAALHGTWINNCEGTSLQAYKLSFTFIPEEECIYSDFVLLIDAILDVDVANTEIDLFLTRKRKARAKFIDGGRIQLNSLQLEGAKAFQEVIFNGMLSKLVRLRKNVTEGSSMSKFKVLLASRKKVKKLWVPSQMYLLLPLIDSPGKSIHVDWKTVHTSAATAKLFMLMSSQTDNGSDVSRECKLTHVAYNDIEEGRVLYFASGSIPSSAVVDMAVITIHTGKIYIVTQVLHGENADSPFSESRDSNAAKYDSYTHYFKEKYGRILNFPKQPLLQLKQTHRLHNLLMHHNDSFNDKLSSQKVKDVSFVEIPPELCLNLGVSSSIVRSLYLFPSVMHRMNALMLASQLRCQIQNNLPQCSSIPAWRISEALTTLRCLEGSSFEGLELLGDSFLKYAVSRYLFLVYDNKHEGQLSARRCRAVCNATLHRLAILQDLPGYIRDEPFDPSQWVAPGMHVPKALKCKCNLENLPSHENAYESEEEKSGVVFKIGKTCNKGHRWMCSKTIADTVEALIGAYFDGGGSDAALEFMIWLGMEVKFDPSLIDVARQRPSVHPNILQSVNTEGLEIQLGYTFRNKGLLVESITHASQQDPQGSLCYQRLEFLGDAVLDLLITKHLFTSHPGLTPGFLTDLRSAAVNNECFARAAVKNNLQRYLRHGSGALLGQITDFVKAVQEVSGYKKHQVFGWEGARGPKVLGDIVESITGAILIDSGFDLDQVWKIMKPLLSPIVTPETLPLHPTRELLELCHLQGYAFSWTKLEKDGKMTIATGEVGLGKEPVIGTARRAHKKTAKKDAAQQILLLLESRGIWHPRRRFSLEGTKESPDVKQKVSIPMVKDNHSERVLQGALVGVKRKSIERLFEGDKKRAMLGSNSSSNKVISHISMNSALMLGTVEEVVQESSTVIQCPIGHDALISNVFGKREDLTDKLDMVKRSILGEDTNYRLKDKVYSSSQDGDGMLDQLVQSGECRSLNLADLARAWPPMTPEGDDGRSKLDDDKESSSFEDSPYLTQKIGNKMADHFHEDKNISNNKEHLRGCTEQGCSMSLANNRDEKIYSGVSLLKSYQMGRGRAALYEYCRKQKWSEPRFDLLKQEGAPHRTCFTFLVEVHRPQKEPLKVTGMPMKSKKEAKDTAALKMLFALKRAGLEIDL